MPHENKIRTLIIEDQPLICEALGQMLHETPVGNACVLDIVALAQSGENGIALFKEFNPDLILLDLLMPGMSGIETLSKLRALCKTCLIIVLTAELNPTWIKEAEKLGANGYHLKNITPEKLISLIEALKEDPEKFVGPPAENKEGVLVTPREREVLIFLVDGYTNKEAAETLGISVRTVEKHRENLSKKLGCLSMTSMKKEAQRLGLLW